MSLRVALPWEVMERIIKHASSDLNLLLSFSLTCRQLRPRSFSLIIAKYVLLGTKDQMSALCSFLRKNTKFQVFVHSITISLADFSPSPLVKMIPHISTLRLVSHIYEKYDDPQERPVIALHPIILGAYRSFGSRIRTLSLDHLSFSTPCELFGLLLAFPNMVQVACNDIRIKLPGGNAAATQMARAKLFEQLQLETLKVRVHP